MIIRNKSIELISLIPDDVYLVVKIILTNYHTRT